MKRSLGERLQCQLFVFKGALAAFVQAFDDGIQKRLIVFDGSKVTTASQFQGLIRAALEGIMYILNRTVFMAHPSIITCCLQVVMATECLIRLRQFSVA